MHATRILIVGAGAQAQVLADLLLLQAEPVSYTHLTLPTSDLV